MRIRAGSVPVVVLAVLFIAAAVTGVPAQTERPRANVAGSQSTAPASSRGAGSTASAASSSEEVRRLAGLCQVWGLLKYYHPSVAGSSNWDEVLISAVPRVKAATSKRAFNQEIVRVVADAGLGYVFRELSVGIPRGAHSLGAHFRWIDDQSLFEAETSLLLKAIVLAHKPGSNWYVLERAGVGSPDFKNELPHASPEYPGEEIRLLALFRYWNMVHYYFPSNNMMDRDWIELLPELVPTFQRAANATEYHLAVAEMTASINDAHASTSSSVLTWFWGYNSAPIQIRLIEDQTVITRVYTRLLAPTADLRVGDMVTHINGTPAATMRATLRKWVHGSNEASLERNIHGFLVRTNDARMRLTVQREEGVLINVEVDCPSLNSVYNEQAVPTASLYTILPGNIGYINMGLLEVAQVPEVMGQLRDTRAIVLDIRNYPRETLYPVSNYLNPWPRGFVKFLYPDYDHPGAFVWTATFSAGPSSPAPFMYTGRVVVLANQETQSAAEYTMMAFKTAPDVTVIGSQTAGADGNVSLIGLPGGISTYFSGLGVFYPGGTPTQRIGIVPDIEVKPTIRGLREGRDEVLEAALQFLR